MTSSEIEMQFRAYVAREMYIRCRLSWVINIIIIIMIIIIISKDDPPSTTHRRWTSVLSSPTMSVQISFALFKRKQLEQKYVHIHGAVHGFCFKNLPFNSLHSLQVSAINSQVSLIFWYFDYEYAR